MTKKSNIVPENRPVDIVVATGNPGKLEELRNLLGDGYRILSAGELDAALPEETGITFAENAMLKARAVADQTGKIAIADDSGLEVQALQGEPGIYTARYAGVGATDEENRRKLLDALAEVEDGLRAARFVSVIAIAFTSDDTETAEGTCDGQITRGERGAGGFGYDSIFEVQGGKTLAELAPDEKNAISHRGVAMKAAREILEERLGTARRGGRKVNKEVHS